MQDKAKQALRNVMRLGADYSDIRLVDELTESILVKNSAVERIGSRETSGVGIRAFFKGGWGFCSVDSLDNASLIKAGKEAFDSAMAASSAVKQVVKLARIDSCKDGYSSKYRKDPFAIPLEDKIELLLDTDRSIRDSSGNVKVSTVFYSGNSRHQFLATSEGTEIDSTILHTNFYLSATAMKNGQVQTRRFGDYTSRGWEFVEEFNPTKIGSEAGRTASKLLDAAIPKSGKSTLIISPQLLSIVVHESLGHPSEADRALGTERAEAGTSFMSELVGKIVGSGKVTLVGDSTVEGQCGYFLYDDEGVRAKKIVLIDKGIFRTFLNNRETASILEEEPNGAARAAAYNYLPIVRITNNFLDNGDWEKDEIIEDTKAGYYLIGDKRSYSIDDKRLNFMFSAEESWRIENGELVEPIKNIAFSGMTPEFYSSVDATGDDLKVYGLDCAKGTPKQYIPVSNGGPTIRVLDIMTFSA